MPDQTTHLGELIIALQALKDGKGDPTLSQELIDLLGNGLHPAVLPASLNVGAAEMFHLTAVGMGGLPRMLRWADRYPAAFYKLYARQMMPTMAPVLPEPEGQKAQEWPEWLSARRLAYQESGLSITDNSHHDADTQDTSE